MQALLFLRLCAKGILNHWVVRAGHRAEKFIVLIVYVYSVWLLPIGIKIRWTNSMEKLLTSSYMFGYLCLYLIFIFFYILFASSFIYTSSYIYSDVMKTIQCSHPPHHHNGFVATCRLWTASTSSHMFVYFFFASIRLRL